MDTPATPLAIVRDDHFDAYGATTTHRVYRRADGFEVEAIREFYTRDGGVEDYDYTHRMFATLGEALDAAGAGQGAA